MTEELGLIRGVEAEVECRNGQDLVHEERIFKGTLYYIPAIDIQKPLGPRECRTCFVQEIVVKLEMHHVDFGLALWTAIL